jgi:hypothetical protein
MYYVVYLTFDKIPNDKGYCPYGSLYFLSLFLATADRAGGQTIGPKDAWAIS